MDLGFEAAGFNVICALEKEEWACDTLRLNHKNLVVLGPPDHSGKVEDWSGTQILAAAKAQPDQIDVVIGGPPCQSFSQAATQRFLKTDPRFKRRGFEDTVRGTLLFEFVRLVLELRPRAFVLENVPGIMTMDDGAQLEIALSALAEEGYATTTPEVLQAADYGVPQLRRRLILWGSRTIKNPALPAPTHTGVADLFTRLTLKPYRTAAHALVNVKQSLDNHITRDHKELSTDRYRKLRFGERDKLGRADRLDPAKPSKTVIAGGLSGGGRSHLHPFVARTLSVRESARLQTFPDSYVFEGSTARQFTQVGNAVPPLLAEQIARKIMLDEFGRKIKGKLLHEASLETDLTDQQLVKRLENAAQRETPELLYASHSNDKKRKLA